MFVHFGDKIIVEVVVVLALAIFTRLGHDS